MTAAALLQLKETGMSQKALVDAVRRRYATGLLLGEVRKSEGNSTLTIGNALNRYAEVGFITLTTGPKGRERTVRPGPQFEQLSRLEHRLAVNLQRP